MRASKLSDEQLTISVDGKEIVETSSEKLLGLVINNTLTWKNHMYGDKDNIGLVPQLGKRLGMLSKLSRYMSKEKLGYFSSGIFYSKLSYCLPVFGNIFGLDTYKEENRRYFSFTVKDNNNLQVLQNKLNRMLLSADYNTPTVDLLEQTGSLSIHQMVAYQTAVATHKIVQSGKSSYIARKMKVRQMNSNTRHGDYSVVIPKYKYNIGREGFIYRGAAIYNKLSNTLRKETKIEKFKSGVRGWVKSNISIKPKQLFQSISGGNQTNHPPPPPPPPEPPPPQQATTRQLPITNFFTPINNIRRN